MYRKAINKCIAQPPCSEVVVKISRVAAASELGNMGNTVCANLRRRVSFSYHNVPQNYGCARAKSGNAEEPVLTPQDPPPDGMSLSLGGSGYEYSVGSSNFWASSCAGTYDNGLYWAPQSTCNAECYKCGRWGFLFKKVECRQNKDSAWPPKYRANWYLGCGSKFFASFLIARNFLA